MIMAECGWERACKRQSADLVKGGALGALGNSQPGQTDRHNRFEKGIGNV